MVLLISVSGFPQESDRRYMLKRMRAGWAVGHWSEFWDDIANPMLADNSTRAPNLSPGSCAISRSNSCAWPRLIVAAAADDLPQKSPVHPGIRNIPFLARVNTGGLKSVRPRVRAWREMHLISPPYVGTAAKKFFRDYPATSSRLTLRPIFLGALMKSSTIVELPGLPVLRYIFQMALERAVGKPSLPNTSSAVKS